MITVFCVRPTRFNIGNDTIFAGLRHLLRDAFGEPINLVQVSALRGETGNSLFGLHPASVHQMNQYGHGVIVGGGNLYENGELEVSTQALRALRPPLMLFSLSHGRIYDQRHRLVPRTDAMADETTRALNRAAAISLARDEATLDYLESLGVTGATLGGCPSLLLSEVSAVRPADSAIRGGTLLSIRHPRLMSVPTRDEARVHGVVSRLIEALRTRTPGPIRLLCHDLRDLEFASSFTDVDYILPDDVHGYLQLLREAALVVSFRLHAFVPCLSYGTPAVNISYDERSMSLVRTLGFDAWDVNFVTSADPVAAVMDRCARLDEYTRLRAEARPRWEALGATMRQASSSFAEQVRRYREALEATRVGERA
jgi:polysaccharide pyruvyl transferase WcaK-like protein